MRNLAATQKCLALFLVALLLNVSVPSISYGQGKNKIYWTEANRRTNTGKIRRAHLDGSYVKDIVTGLQAPKSIALDMLRRKVYWSDEGTRKIQRADLTGRNVEDIIVGFQFPSGGGSISISCRDGKCTGIASPWKGGEMWLSHDLLINPGFLALDIQREKIYWINQMLDHIQRANLDGSDVGDIATLAFSNALTLDRSRGKIYWTNYSENKIRRANLDGSNVEDIVTTSHEPVSLALDVARRKIYWTVWKREFGPHTIQRANLDGSDVEEIFTNSYRLTSLALDPVGGKIYWITSGSNESDTDTGKIQRSNLDGSDIENIITGLNNPWSIALDFPGVHVTPSIDKLTTTWAKVKIE